MDQLLAAVDFAGAVTKDNTVLRYGPREGPSDFAHPDFTPVFLDETPKELQSAGERMCGGNDSACVYDYVVSGSRSFALMTKDTRQTALKDNADISKLLTSIDLFF